MSDILFVEGDSVLTLEHPWHTAIDKIERRGGVKHGTGAIQVAPSQLRCFVGCSGVRPRLNGASDIRLRENLILH
jgi:hypothetical protein